MYAMGEGVPEDDIQAYAWISLASAQGVENAKELKILLTRKMTRAEFAEAQKLSREYREDFGPGLKHRIGIIRLSTAQSVCRRSSAPP